jgi:hypothetical protein
MKSPAKFYMNLRRIMKMYKMIVFMGKAGAGKDSLM